MVNHIIRAIIYFSGTTKNDIKEMYEEIIDTTDEDIRGFADMIEKILKQNYISVVGGEKKIRENKNLFDSIKTFENMIQSK
jgi:Zn-dependent M16 (insulinase) family peptidase